MDSCSSNLKIHQRMGTTQKERFPAALDTGYFLIDERTEIDYIEYVQKLSEYVLYFDNNNFKSGNWKPFFENESTSILVSLFRWDINGLMDEYKKVKAEIKASSLPQPRRELLNDYFETVKKIVDQYQLRISSLDSSIAAKEYFQQTEYSIKNLLEVEILGKVNNPEQDIITLINSYQFEKNVQQLFGLFFNWQNTSKDTLNRQLESFPGHTPHYALFLAFLKLLGIAREQLNNFTKRHLDFYYKDVLQLSPLAARPDFVHLIARPAVLDKKFVLPKNSVFLAGKNIFGQNRYFKSTADHVVNNIALKHFYSAFINNTPQRRQANLMPLNGAGTPFSAFPEADANTEYIPYDAPSETGILLASSLLFLSGGDRYIKLSFNGTRLDNSSYRFFLTGEKGVFEVTEFMPIPAEEDERAATGGNSDIYLYLPPAAQKVVAYDAAIHGEIKVATTFPVLKIVPKNQLTTFILDNAAITIDVTVRNFKNFVLATDTGTVDINKPFQPFGDFPKNGNGYMIGSNEFFIKKGAELSIHTDYQTGSTIYIMHGGIWTPTEEGPDNIINTSPLEVYSDENELPDTTSVAGYLRVELEDKAYEGESFLRNFIAATTKEGEIPVPPQYKYIYLNYYASSSTSSATGSPIEVFEIFPFGFQYKQLTSFAPESLFATRSFTEVVKSSALLQEEMLVKRTPYIKIKKLPNRTIEQSLPLEGGDIFLGFENALVGNSLSLLFQMAEGTVNPTKEPAKVTWKYLKNDNTWGDFRTSEIGDETDGLQQSGLVSITVPEDYNTNGITILPDNLFWIKIGVDTTDAICEFLGIHEHALKAVLTDFDKSGSYFIENIPKNTISKLYQPVNFIKKIEQPYPSFGGNKKEDDALMYQRSSERLRHKNKAITIWDYERLVLQQYPEVARVKCLNHYRYDTKTPNAHATSNVAAGYVTLIPIARINNTEKNTALKPLISLGTMAKIKQFIAAIASPHARIMVKPPSLEKIKLTFNVKYRDFPGADTRLYESNLIEAINRFLSPWAYDPDGEVEFAGSVEISSLVRLIDNQPYVDYITEFKVDQIVQNQQDGSRTEIFTDVKKLVPQSDFTLFVPNDVHTITKINDC